MSLVACGNYQTASFRVVNSATGDPVKNAKFDTEFIDGFALSLSDLFRPDWTYAKSQEDFSDDEGMAHVRFPLGRTTGLGVASPEGARLDPEDHATTTLRVTKEGFHAAKISHSNNEWRDVGHRATPRSPIVISLRKR